MKNSFLKKRKILQNHSGFIAADFLFSFVLVIGCGIIIFALTFSLATIEVSQYITWSAARAYSAAAKTEDDSKKAGKSKFNNLAAHFPLLTGVGGNSSWFELSEFFVGDEASQGFDPVDKNNAANGSQENRHPWTGARAKLELKLFQSLRIPFLGNIVNNPSEFKFYLRSFILRNPSQKECLEFFKKRFEKGISQLENKWDNKISYPAAATVRSIEDNGC